MKTERKEYQKVMTPKEAERAILNIIYSNEFTAADQIDGTYYDIEHLATKELMKTQLARFNSTGEQYTKSKLMIYKMSKINIPLQRKQI